MGIMFGVKSWLLQDVPLILKCDVPCLTTASTVANSEPFHQHDWNQFVSPLVLQYHSYRLYQKQAREWIVYNNYINRANNRMYMYM